jgi:23S rRNA pseudouridine1911/1915/1917 synthase
MEEPIQKYELHRFLVDKGQSMLRIDKFLFDKIENVSRTKIQNAAEQGYILVNDLEVKSNYKVKPGDVIQVMSDYLPEKIELLPEDLPLNVIYEDDDILIINKSPGMVVHPAFGNETGTLVNALMFHLKDLPLFNTGEIRAGLVHRLDKNTSGIMIIGKTEFALSHLSKQFSDKTPSKIYYALVWGVPKNKEGTIVGHVGRSLQDRKKMNVFPNGEHGKEAITHYKIVKDLSYVSLIECKLETGRTHQIRVHLKHIGNPVFGDPDYGGREILRGTRHAKYKQFISNCFEIMPYQALHAKEITFKHPVSGQIMYFQTELPENFKTLLAKWENYIAQR